MRTKLSKAENKINTAEEFIDNVASSSSTSGKPYSVILPNSRTVHASVYFHELLREVDAKRETECGS